MTARGRRSRSGACGGPGGRTVDAPPSASRVGPRSWADVRGYLDADLAHNNEVLPRIGIRLFRIAQWLHRDRRRALKPLRAASHLAWVGCSTVMGLELWQSTAVGPGLALRHGARGSVVSPDAVLGADVELFHGVTIGGRRGTDFPVIGDGVRLYPGSIVLGRVSVGAGAMIGAGAVVLTDVPAGGSAVSPKARVLPPPPPSDTD